MEKIVPQTENQNYSIHNKDWLKAGLLGISSFILAGINPLLSAALGYVGAKAYENETGKKVGAGGYTVAGFFGAGIINPYTIDAVAS